MPLPVVRYFERDIITPGPGLTELDVPNDRFAGFDPVTNNPVLKPLTPFKSIPTDDEQSQPKPLSGTITGSMPTATTAQCHVAYTEPGDRPPVTIWHWFRDGTERGTTTEPTRDFLFPSVPNDSNPHTFWVRGENSNGLGDLSNQLSLTWGGPGITAPLAPTQFARHNLTSAQIDFVWTEPDNDARVDKIALFGDGKVPGVNPPLVDNIDPGALAFTWSGATFGAPGTQHTAIGIARHIPDVGAPNNGWSSISNTVTFKVPVTQVQHDPVMGFDNGKWFTDATMDVFPAADAVRSYTIGDALGIFNQTGCRVLAVTTNNTEGSITTSNGALAASLKAALEGFYYFSDGTPRTGARDPLTGCEWHFATDNETDTNNGHAYSAGYGGVVAACADVIHNTLGGPTGSPGGRRYPRASMWADFTVSNVKNATKSGSYKPIARYLDGFACSMYPPGRQSYAGPGINGSTSKPGGNILWSDYSYMAGVFTVIQDWMLTGGASGGPSNITMYATWEIASPIDHPVRDGTHIYDTTAHTGTPPTDPQIGQPTDLTNFSIRPRYFTGGVDSTGHDWKGSLQYILEQCDAIGCKMREQLYWNLQSNPDIPNPLFFDQTNRAWDARTYTMAPWGSQTGHGATRAAIDTETAWRNWKPGVRLPNG